MQQAIEYLVKLAISLGAVYLFYHILLRRLTFYNWNRFYLLFYTFLSFVIPFVDVSPVVQRQDWTGSGLIHWIPALEVDMQVPVRATDPVSSFNPAYLLTVLILSGMLVMLGRLLLQLFSFRRLMKKAKLVGDGTVRVYQVDAQIIPFSFGRSVFINAALHGEEELKSIIRHEFVHARQRHTADIIWSEILCVLNWYNPFAWLLRRAIRQNLEFIADRQVLNHGIDRKQYQYLLLKVIGSRQFSITPQFNFSSLKKRIAMMNKMRSAGLHLLKFLFLIPILSVLLLAFRNQGGSFSADALFPVTDTVSPVEINKIGYYLDVVGINGECFVRVLDRNRKEIEMISLAAWNAQPDYADKYGKLLPPPASRAVVAPPPPVPPKPADAKPAMAPVPPQAPVPPGCQPANTPVPPVATGLKNASLVREFEITRRKAIMKMKDGSTEEYDLTDPGQRKRFEIKYGRIHETTAGAPTVFAASGTNGATAITAPPGDAVWLQPSRIITGEEDIVITITRSTTREQLDALVGQMKEKGVELKFTNLDFNDGELRSLSGTMKKKGSTSNFSVTDLEILVLAMTEKEGQVWFKVSTREPDRVI